MDTVYVITREGVYRHETLGIYLDRDIAVLEAIEAIEAERDDYHDISVTEYGIGFPITNDGKSFCHVVRKDDPIGSGYKGIGPFGIFLWFPEGNEQ